MDCDNIKAKESYEKDNKKQVLLKDHVQICNKIRSLKQPASDLIVSAVNLLVPIT